MKPILRRALLAAPHTLAIVLASPALAQTYELPEPPIRSNVDERGVDLASGQVRVSDPQLSIGTADNGLALTRTWAGENGWRHNYMIAAYADAANHVTVMSGSGAVGFTKAGSVYTPDQNDDSKLTETSSNYTYTSTDGTVILFDKSLASSNTSYYGAITAVATQITRPDGFKTSLTYRRDVWVSAQSIAFWVLRLQSVNTSTGFQIKFTYASNTLTEASANDWIKMTNVRAINNANDYCDPAADTCSGFTQSWPSVSYTSSLYNGYTTETVTVDGVTGLTRKFLNNSTGQLLGIRRPSSPGIDNTTYAYSSQKVVGVGIRGAAADGISDGNWTYAFTPGTGTLTASVTTPTVPTPRTVVTDTASLLPKTDTDENGRTTTYEWCPSGTADCKPGLLTKVSRPDGNFTTYRYDPRGNRISMTANPKPGSGLGTLTTYAAYPVSCTGSITPATCNKPITTNDTAGNVTNYFYNSNGLLDYVQLPAPAVGAPRPETHYNYWSGGAWYKISSNNVDLSPNQVTWLLNTATCITGSWPCTTDKQKVVQIGYLGGPSPTNMQVNGYTVRRGDGTQSSTTSFVGDAFGNIVTMTDPTGRVSRSYYDNARQVYATVDSSVDGTSTGQARAVGYGFNADGQVSTVRLGSSQANGPAFMTLQLISTEYDLAGRKIAERLQNAGGTTTYALKQWSYNGAGRLDCETVRMNSATFASPPAACTLGTQGSDGPDRITHYNYEYAGLIHQVQTGYGTSLQQTVEYNRTINDVLSQMIDAKGNSTSYAIDGHDRAIRECYNAQVTACQNGTATDKVQLTYDSVGRLTNRGLRGHPDGITIGYVYDKLGRTTNVNYPGGGTYDAPVTYTYDNLGQLLQASDTNTHLANFGYDARGFVVSQGDAISTRTMQYDAAGRRTRLTWPDGRYVTYEYNPAGAMSAIKENGSSLLASFVYDVSGRRTSLTRGNGVVTNYDYDPATSRMTCLRHNLTGGSTLNCTTATGQDQATSFTYNLAGQIKSRTGANNAYAWTGHYNLNRSYTPNALNQYTAAGSVTPTYDVKGNLASAGGSASYAYSTKNELAVRGDTGIGFYHDPLGRLDAFNGVPGGLGFHYVDNQISDEFSGASGFPTIKRYVYGPGADEVLVQYDGADFSNKKYLVADERGSIVAITDTAGNSTAINTYDEYGIPGAGNQGRFQYTGQAWIPELGMYSYKARVYSPNLGRFLQTDPAGYPDGPNWYNYTNADPINGSDPLGMQVDPCLGEEICVTGTRVPNSGSNGNIDYGHYGYPGDTGDQEGRAQREADHEIDYCLSLGYSNLTYCRNLQPQPEAASSEQPQSGDSTSQPGDIVVTGHCTFGCQIARFFSNHSTGIGNGVAAAAIIAGGGPEDPIGDAAALALREEILQLGGNTVKSSTARALGIGSRREAGRALESLKRFEGYGNDFHGAILRSGNYVNPTTGELIGNIFDFLP